MATLIAFAAMCLASSVTYIINDIRDVEADRLHEQKRHRPIAAGRVSVAVALVRGRSSADICATGPLALMYESLVLAVKVAR